MEINDLPDKPGVYIFKDKAGMPIYIGKAASLKKRLSYYINPKSFKARILISNIFSYEYLVCDSELEALLLEANLIKKHKPRFNISLKDDKAYPFIKITKEEFPRILITRRLTKDGHYFGPYRGGDLRRTIRLAKELFKIRSCKGILKERSPCLLFHIGQCLAPCKGGLDIKKYNKNVDSCISFLSGKYKPILKSLTLKMKEEAKRLNFEEAARIRDKISTIKSIFESQKAFFTKPINCDIVGTSINHDRESIFVLLIREGRLIGNYSFNFSISPDLLSGFIKQFYLFTGNIPDEIIIEEEIDDKELISSILSERKGKRVLIKVPKRGKKKELLLLAKKNASISLLSSSKIRTAEFLGRISAIDISAISGDYAAGSVVVFENGIPNKSEYRRFKIKTQGPDDYGMIREVIERYFKGLISKNKPFPELLIIDGGKGQLNLAINTLKSLGINNVRVISIAKDPDRIFQEDKEPIKLLTPSIFQYIRDEAHRFALSYHKNLRSFMVQERQESYQTFKGDI